MRTVGVEEIERTAVSRLELAYQLLAVVDESPDLETVSKVLDDAAAVQLQLASTMSDAHARILGRLRNAVKYGAQPKFRGAQLAAAREDMLALKAWVHSRWRSVNDLEPGAALSGQHGARGPYRH